MIFSPPGMRSRIRVLSSPEWTGLKSGRRCDTVQMPGVLLIRLPMVVARLSSGNGVWGGKSRVLRT